MTAERSESNGNADLRDTKSLPSMNNLIDISLRDEFNYAIDLVSETAAWEPATVKLVQNIFLGVVNKIERGNIKSWKRDFAAGEWYALFDLVETIQDFIFYRPLRDISKPLDDQLETILTPAPPNYESPGKFRRRRGRFGLHVVGNQTEDLGLANRVVKLFKTLGIKSSDNDPPEDDLSPRERQTWNKAVTHAKAFDLFTNLFNLINHDGIDSEKAQKLLVKVGEILECDKHANNIGNLFGVLNVVKFRYMQTLNKDNTLTGRLQKQLAKTRQHASNIAREKAEAYLEKCVACQVMIVAQPPPLSNTQVTQKDVYVRACSGTKDTSRYGNSFRMFKALSGNSSREIHLIGGQPAVEALNPETSLLEASMITTEESDIEVCCASCNLRIEGGSSEAICAIQKYWHPHCFNCSECSVNLMSTMNGDYFECDGKPYCRKDFVSKFHESCCYWCLEATEGFVMKIGACVWHPEHFFCSSCNELIPQGDEYRIHSGSPFCVTCHIEYITCALCNKICQEEYIRSMGRAWHPHCLRCMHCAAPCGRTEENQIVMTGYHALKLSDATSHGREKYGEAFRLLPEGWSASVDSQSQIETFKSDGKHSLEFPSGDFVDTKIHLDNRELPFCTSCFYRFFFDYCSVCDQPLDDDSVAREEDYVHRSCFKCLECHVPFDWNEGYINIEDGAVCNKCYELNHTDRCPRCNDVISSLYVKAPNGDLWHEECVSCTVCASVYDPSMGTSFLFGPDGKPYCLEHHEATFNDICAGCSKPIVGGDEFDEICGQKWHLKCVICSVCGCSLPDDLFHRYADEKIEQEETGKDTNSDGEIRKILLYCRKDYMDLFLPKCFGCKQSANPQEEQCISFQGNVWHSRCLVCSNCNCKLTTQAGQRNGKMLCKDCLKVFLIESAQKMMPPLPPASSDESHMNHS